MIVDKTVKELLEDIAYYGCKALASKPGARAKCLKSLIFACDALSAYLKVNLK